ncbi:MAG: hypothetical protein GYB67_01695 [Chloroflexi bacterium]|nr:hypothetical protein [Chloroflexota bacterium]
MDAQNPASQAPTPPHTEHPEVDALLNEGQRAFRLGHQRRAHTLWRRAASLAPYDERIWQALLQVLTDDADRRVCLENIVAINPLNSEARQQLRALRGAQPPLPSRLPTVTPQIRQPTTPAPSFGQRRRLIALVLVALLAVMIAVAASGMLGPAG